MRHDLDFESAHRWNPNNDLLNFPLAPGNNLSYVISSGLAIHVKCSVEVVR